MRTEQNTTGYVKEIEWTDGETQLVVEVQVSKDIFDKDERVYVEVCKVYNDGYVKSFSEIQED